MTPENRSYAKTYAKANANPNDNLSQIEKNEINKFFNSDYNKKYPKRKDTLLISDCMARKNISENSYNECVKEINDKKRISNKLSLILKINNNEDLKNYVGTYINRSLDSTITNNFFKHTDGELYSLKQFPIGTWDVTDITDMSSLFENGRRYIDIFDGKNIY